MLQLIAIIAAAGLIAGGVAWWLLAECLRAIEEADAAQMAAEGAALDESDADAREASCA